MRATKCAVLTVVLLIGSVGALAAQRGDPGVRGNTPRTAWPQSRAFFGFGSIVLRDSALDRLAELIELTDDQEGQLRELAGTYRSENADALQRMERMKEELQILHDGDERPTRQALNEVVGRYDHPDLDLDRANRRLDRDVRAILTPEQEILLARRARLIVQDARSGLATRRTMQPRGARRARDQVRRPLGRQRRSPVSRMRTLRRRPPRPIRP